jgi:hypothetical protein
MLKRAIDEEVKKKPPLFFHVSHIKTLRGKKNKKGRKGVVLWEKEG